MALLVMFRSRFVRLLLVVGVSLTGILGGLLASVRAAQPAPACLIYWRDGSNRLIQLNIRTGAVGPYHPELPMDFSLGGHNPQGDPSPDGKHLVFWDYQNGTLQVSSTDTHKVRVLETNSQLGNGGQTYVYNWSPDQKHLAYITQDLNSGDTSLVLADPDSGQKRTLYLGQFPNDPVFLEGWSADGDYLAFSFGTNAGGHLNVTGQYRFVAVRDWRIMPPTLAAIDITFGNEEPYLRLTWSPQGHTFAYITPGNTNFRMVIATPEEDAEQSLGIRIGAGGYMDALRWSPDGRVVALEVHIDDSADDQDWDWYDFGFWHVYFLGIDGTKAPDALSENVFGSESVTPEGWWSADGRAWVFWHRFKMQGLDEDQASTFSYLMAYYLDEKRFQVLASDVLDSLVPLPVANGRTFVVQVGDAPYDTVKPPKILLVPSDGKKPVTLLEDGHDMGWYDLIISEDAGGFSLRWSTPESTTSKSIFHLTWVWADGSGQIYLTRMPDDPPTTENPRPWLVPYPSPDGRYVAALFQDETAQDTLALLTRGGQAVRLPHLGNGSLGDPVWSSDGSMLAFVQRVDKPTVYIYAKDGSLLNHFDYDGEADGKLLAWTWCTG